MWSPMSLRKTYHFLQTTSDMPVLALSQSTLPLPTLPSALPLLTIQPVPHLSVLRSPMLLEYFLPSNDRHPPLPPYKSPTSRYPTVLATLSSSRPLVVPILPLCQCRRTMLQRALTGLPLPSVSIVADCDDCPYNLRPLCSLRTLLSLVRRRCRSGSATPCRCQTARSREGLTAFATGLLPCCPLTMRRKNRTLELRHHFRRSRRCR